MVVAQFQEIKLFRKNSPVKRAASIIWYKEISPTNALPTRNVLTCPLCSLYVQPMFPQRHSHIHKGKVFILTGSYNPILKPPYTHWRCKPGTMPFHRADMPSSLAIVLIVPSKPLYLGIPVPSLAGAFFWS